MDASMLNVGNNQAHLKVSISTRLLAALAYIIPAIGGALSSFLLIRVFRALETAESAGIVAVMEGVKEASLPAIISLYLAAVIGIAVIIVLAVRIITQTTTASPPIWFFLLGGIFGLLPVALFWFGKFLVVEALSPGSSMNNTGGLGNVGASISQLLMLSIIAAPFIVILLIAASVLPLSSRSNAKWLPLAAATVIQILLIAAAVAVPFLINEPKRKNELVNLPEVKNAVSDYQIEKQSSMVLTLTADNKLYERQHQDKQMENKIITKEELPEKLKSSMRDKTPDRRIVYFKGDVNASFENVLQIFDRFRKADIENVGLVVFGKKNEDNPYQLTPLRFEVKLPQPINTNEVVKPNPLTLVVMLESGGKLTLNREDMGTISDTKRLEDTLVKIFRERESNGVFRESTNEVEKTVYLKVSKFVKYGDFIKLVEAVTIADAQPIGIQIDDINL